MEEALSRYGRFGKASAAWEVGQPGSEGLVEFGEASAREEEAWWESNHLGDEQCWDLWLEAGKDLEGEVCPAEHAADWRSAERKLVDGLEIRPMRESRWDWKATCRIGEARIPGPYSVGGASSSGGRGHPDNKEREDKENPWAPKGDRSEAGIQEGKREAAKTHEARSTVGALGDEDCWEQDQWIRDCEVEGLMGDGIGAGLNSGYSDLVEWQGQLEAEVEYLKTCDLENGIENPARGRDEDIGDKWWGMHFNEVGRAARGGEKVGGASGRPMTAVDYHGVDEREWPAVQEELDMAAECGVSGSATPRQIDWKKVEEQLA